MAASSHEEQPLGKLIPPVPRGVEIPPEPPDVGARALYVASRLLAGATTFFFLAFLFAYFYLRSLNQDNMWRPPHVNPEPGFGVAVVACVLISAAFAILAGRRMKAQSRGWTAPALIALVLGLAAVAAAVHRLHAPALRSHRRGLRERVLRVDGLLRDRGARHDVLAGDAGRDRDPRAAAPAEHGDIEDPDRLIAPGLDACVFYWAYLAGIGAIAYVTLYLV